MSPTGRLLAFAPGNVSTRIRLITSRPSLFPVSQTHTPVVRPCDLSTGKPGMYKVSMFRVNTPWIT